MFSWESVMVFAFWSPPPPHSTASLHPGQDRNGKDVDDNSSFVERRGVVRVGGQLRKAEQIIREIYDAVR